MSIPAGVRALEEGRAYVDLTSWHTVTVTGADAVRWLEDLVTNRVGDIPESVVRRTLLLDRTGRVKADLVVTLWKGSLVLAQDPVQPVAIETLLERYVLSSDVILEDRTGDIGIVALPEGGAPKGLLRLDGTLGEAGDADRRDQLRRFAERDLVEASLQDLEVARIRGGHPRFGVDFDDDWLPSEAGLDDLVDTNKGCFLGQESVARVRNLGHPPRLVLAFESPGRVYPMAPISAGSEQVGRITSVAPLDDGERTACIGWIRWNARDADLVATGDFSLRVREPF